MKSWFLPVRGGPAHGREYYDGLDPVPGRRVVIVSRPPAFWGGVKSENCGWYEIAADGKSVQWKAPNGS